MRSAGVGRWWSEEIEGRIGNEEIRRGPNYRRNTNAADACVFRGVRAQPPTHELGGRVRSEKKEITRTRSAGVASREPWVPCDIHVSRLFMTGGTSGRTRVQRGNETQPVRLTRTLYAGERKRESCAEVELGRGEKKIETTPCAASTRGVAQGRSSVSGSLRLKVVILCRHPRKLHIFRYL